MDKANDAEKPAWTTNLTPPPVEPQDAPDVTIEQPDGFVYHYTSPAGLIGIVDSRKEAKVPRELTFFASDILQMNDMSELEFSLGIIQDQLKELEADDNYSAFIKQWLPIFEKYLSSPSVEALELAPRPCVCAVSFTTKDDLLSQWVTYGTGGGFAIGLDADTLRDTTYIGHNTRTGEAKTFKSQLHRMHYGDYAKSRIQQLSIFSEMGLLGLQFGSTVQTLISAYQALRGWLKDPQHRVPPAVAEHAMAAIAIGIASQYKHQAFEAESEWRLLVGAGSYGDLTHLLSGHVPPKFRASGTRLLAYRPVTVKPVDDGPVIRDLVVGPAADQAPLVHAAQQLLIANGHNPGVVRASKIPYRGW